MRRSAVVALALVAIIAGGCQSTGSGQMTGTILGSVAGGLAGSMIGGGAGRVIAVGVGAALGGLIGSELGAMLDSREQEQMQRRTQVVLSNPSLDLAEEWHDPQRNRTYKVWATTPPERLRTAQGTQQQCRSFVQEVDEGGRKHTEPGYACRTPDGDWKVVS